MDTLLEHKHLPTGKGQHDILFLARYNAQTLTYTHAHTYTHILPHPPHPLALTYIAEHLHTHKLPNTPFAAPQVRLQQAPCATARMHSG